MELQKLETETEVEMDIKQYVESAYKTKDLYLPYKMVDNYNLLWEHLLYKTLCFSHKGMGWNKYN